MNAETLLFFEGSLDSLAIYTELEQTLMAAYPHMTIKVQKTQISFYGRCGFGCASQPRKRQGLMVTFGLPFKLDSGRILAAAVPYPGQ